MKDLGTISKTLRIGRQVTNVREDVNFEQSIVGLPPGQIMTTTRKMPLVKIKQMKQASWVEISARIMDR